MAHESEIVALLVGIAGLSFAIHHRARLREVPAFDVLLASFVAMLIGWLASAVEEVGQYAALMLFKHLCNAVSAAMLALWCWRAFRGQEGRG